MENGHRGRRIRQIELNRVSAPRIHSDETAAKPASPPEPQPSNETESSPWLGAGLFAIGSIAAVLAADIRKTGIGENNDPGPGAFPVTLSLLLVAGGLTQWALWFRARRAGASINPPTNRSGGHPSAGARNARVLALAATVLALYLAALPALGFPICSLVFVIFWARYLKAGWIGSVLTAGILVAVIHALFAVFFKVQLPRGALF